MNKRPFLIALCSVGLMAGTVAFSRIKSSAHSAPPPAAGVQTPQRGGATVGSADTKPAADVPEHVVYGLLFREVAAFRRKAEQMRDRGQDASALRDFHKQRAKLNDREAQALDQAADDCVRALAPLDNKAKALIQADRAHHPGGLLQPGEALPLPPAKLKDLEQQRRKVILGARDQLRAAMGETEFQRLDQFARQDIADRIKPVQRSSASHR
jgi:hypothetical protein